MIKSSKVLARESGQQGVRITPESQVVWQIMQNSANDNLMPALSWFKQVIWWTIIVGSILAYVIF